LCETAHLRIIRNDDDTNTNISESLARVRARERDISACLWAGWDAEVSALAIFACVPAFKI